MSTGRQTPSGLDSDGPRSEIIGILRAKGPQLASELPSEPRAGATRQVVSFLRVQGGASSHPDRPPLKPVETIWYLYGDERRAVRRFATEYPELTEWSVTSGGGDAVVSSVDPIVYQMLVEEYEWRAVYEGGAVDA